MGDGARSKISVVSPVYRAEYIVDELVTLVSLELSKITDHYEILLVEDGSPDHSWEKIEAICRLDKRVKGIRLSSNFGQHYAITAGIDHATGEWVVVMDCDLQDRPGEIIRLYEKALEGYDIVMARRENRMDGFLKRMFSKIFYHALSVLTHARHDAAVANFGIYNFRVTDAIRNMQQASRYFPSMLDWPGFKTTTIDVQHAARASGTTSYNLSRLARLATEIILAFSQKPLRISITVFFVISAIAFFATVYHAICAFSCGLFFICCIRILISGLMFILLYLSGLYVMKALKEIKGRTYYSILHAINIDSKIK